MKLNLLSKVCLGAVLCLSMLCLPAHAVSPYTQWFTVDCSGATPGAYTSINAVIPLLTNGSSIYLVPHTTCNESVTLTWLSYIWLGTDPSATATLNGSLNIADADSVYIQSLNVRSSPGDGITVDSSRDVRFDACSSSYNAGRGLNISGASSVTVQALGNYSSNGNDGILVGQNSYLSLMPWGGVIDVSSNAGRGLSIDRSVFQSLGNVSITHNNDIGLEMEGSSTGVMMPIFGPNTISSNTGSGIHVAENSQISLGGDSSWAPYLNIIQGNGPVGISLEREGQLTLFGEVQIQDHTFAGIDVSENSQATFLLGLNQVIHNGYGTEAGRAGIRVESNSQLYLLGAVIAQSGGPGVLALVNSSLDIEGTTFNSNAGGAVGCDSSAFVTGDLTAATLGSANSCKVAMAAGQHHRSAPRFSAPDWRPQKAYADKMHAFVKALHH